MAAAGLGEYVDVLLAEKFDLLSVGELTNDDLKELGVPMAPRKAILKLKFKVPPEPERDPIPHLRR